MTQDRAGGHRGAGEDRHGLPATPAIPEAALAPGHRPLRGEVKVGEGYAWEPALPHARELVVVMELTPAGHVAVVRVAHACGEAFITERRGAGVWTVPIDGGRLVWNDMARFREACVRTRFALQVPLPAGKGEGEG